MIGLDENELKWIKLILNGCTHIPRRNFPVVMATSVLQGALVRFEGLGCRGRHTRGPRPFNAPVPQYTARPLECVESMQVSMSCWSPSVADCSQLGYRWRFSKFLYDFFDVKLLKLRRNPIQRCVYEACAWLGYEDIKEIKTKTGLFSSSFAYQSIVGTKTFFKDISAVECARNEGLGSN